MKSNIQLILHSYLLLYYFKRKLRLYIKTKFLKQNYQVLCDQAGVVSFEIKINWCQ